MKTSDDGNDAEGDVPVVRIAGAEQEVGVEDPVIEPDRERDDAERPEKRRVRAPLGRSIGDQPEKEKQQKADMHRPDDLARERRVGGRPKLVGGKGDGDEEEHARRRPGAPAVFLGLARQRCAVGGFSRHGAFLSRPAGGRNEGAPKRPQASVRARRLPCSSAPHPDAAAPADSSRPCRARCLSPRRALRPSCRGSRRSPWSSRRPRRREHRRW